MTEIPQESISFWIQQARNGEPSAAARLWESVYDEVKRIARQAVAREPNPHAVQPTEIAHDAYLRLAGQEVLAYESRAHLLATVARAIRHLLVDQARNRKALKRGGASLKMQMTEELATIEPINTDLLDLDEALSELESRDSQSARLIELRFFGGMTLDEAADVVGISRRSVANDWALARAWLRRRLGESS